MRIISVNTGMPRQILYRGRIVTTGIFKDPVVGKIHVGKSNLQGDGQADLSVHGGFSKAVYVYPAEHYAYWRRKLDVELSWGAFGENLTSEGLVETSLRIGDRFRIGTAELRVTEPRLPCHKLALRFDRGDIVKLFLSSRLTGFYLAVEKEGDVSAGDAVEFLGGDNAAVSITEVVDVYLQHKRDPLAINRVLGTKFLPESWRVYFQEQLEIVRKRATNDRHSRVFGGE